MDADQLLDPKFDFEAFIRKARLGFVELTEREEELVALIEANQEELTNVREQRTKLENILHAAGVMPEKNLRLTPGRRINVTQITQKVVDGLERDAVGLFPAPVTEQEITDKVQAIEPDARAKSVQSALYRMVQAGKLQRFGKRGSFSYQPVPPWEDVTPPSQEDLPPAPPVRAIDFNPHLRGDEGVPHPVVSDVHLAVRDA